MLCRKYQRDRVPRNPITFEYEFDDGAWRLIFMFASEGSFSILTKYIWYSKNFALWTFLLFTKCLWQFLPEIFLVNTTLQSLTGKYREIQGNPCNENRDPAMRTGFPVSKTGFSLWELTYREFSVSITGFGFAV